MAVHVISFNDKRVLNNAIAINTTSRSTGWSKGLSPFFLGPVDLYDGYIAKNVENGWQYTKVYSHHLGADTNPNEEYFRWAKIGWDKNYADRYPMGKGAVPIYSWWAGEKLDYITARKKIYLPLYAKAVQKSPAWIELLNQQKLAKVNHQDLYLQDFDGYDHKFLGLNYQQVIENPQRKMGHAFVLAMLLDGEKLCF